MSPKRPILFREYLQKHRKLAGASVTLLAARIGVSDGMVRHWERGAGLPQIHHQAAIAEVLGVDLAVVATMIALEAAQPTVAV
jgi:transcriptional regulator with XRE-family HTH domain